MANKIIVIVRIAKDAITISSDIGLMDPDYKKVIIIHMSRLSHSHTFIFGYGSFSRYRLKIITENALRTDMVQKKTKRTPAVLRKKMVQYSVTSENLDELRRTLVKDDIPKSKRSREQLRY
jgi:hypothetical protein